MKLAEADEALDELEQLIRRINRTNAATDLGADGTMTDALAGRDVLRLRHGVLSAAADAATGDPRTHHRAPPRADPVRGGWVRGPRSRSGRGSARSR